MKGRKVALTLGRVFSSINDSGSSLRTFMINSLQRERGREGLIDSIRNEKVDDRNIKKYLPDLTRAMSLVLSRIDILLWSHLDLRDSSSFTRSCVMVTSRRLRIRMVSVLSSSMGKS